LWEDQESSSNARIKTGGNYGEKGTNFPRRAIALQTRPKLNAEDQKRV